MFICPVIECDSESFKTQRGCRKHVFTKHGWYFFFDSKPNIYDYFPEHFIKSQRLTKENRASTSSMPSFLKTSNIAKTFGAWLQSPGGGGKGVVQVDQITIKILKYLKFCCDDVCSSWDIPNKVSDYCIGSVTLVSEFIDHLSKEWKVRPSGILGYINALGHFLDFRRYTNTSSETIYVFMTCEIYLQRSRKCLQKQMRLEWNEVLSIEHLNQINCWASLTDLQNVIPFHADKFSQILIIAGDENNMVAPHDLSFATSFIVVVLFIMVKATRPMSYLFLTVDMIMQVRCGGTIDQSMFKTNFKYGFDSLIISPECSAILVGYINCIRNRLNPTCDYLLVSRNGTQLKQLSNIFGRMVFLAIGKYVNPTRFRQIVETESVEKLTVEEQQTLSEDQKHSSRVAKVHYQKLHSRDVAEKGNSVLKNS